MRKFLVIVALGIAIQGFSQLNEREKSIETKRYYPIKIESKWRFKDSKDSIFASNLEFDTIHFCVYDYLNTYFLGVNNNRYELLDPNLKLISTGRYDTFILNENNIFLQNRKTWTRFNFIDLKVSTFQADSLFASDELVYVFNQNKVGIISNSLNIAPKYDRVIPFSSNENKSSDKSALFLVLNEGKYGLIDQKGKIILNPIASIINYENFGIIKFKEGNWKYLFPNGKIIDPKGKEIHFHATNQYKIYNEARTKATLYVNFKEVVATNYYEDVFPLNENNSCYAVRKNHKIGVLNSNFQVIIAPFCDQIEQLYSVSSEYSKTKYFKYLLGECWGVIDIQGKIITQAKYHNILCFLTVENRLQFKIAMNGKIGIIEANEKILVPTIYEDVERKGLSYIVKENGRLGLLDKKGKEVLPTVYETYDENEFFTESTNLSSLLIFEKQNEYIFLNNRAQMINSKPCNGYDYTNSILKCYYKDRIDVLMLKNGIVEDLTSYPNIERVMILEEVDFRNLKGFTIGFHEKSYLELNQLKSLYGARNYVEKGLALQPIYTKNKSTAFEDYFEAATLTDSNVLFKTNEFPELIASDIFNRMDCDNSIFLNDIIISSTAMRKNYWGSSSEDEILFYKDKRTEFLSNSHKTNIDQLLETSDMIYLEEFEDNIQKIYYGKSFNIQRIENSSLSLVDYFNFLNTANNLFFPNEEVAKEIMNPCMGVKFDQDKMIIRNTNDPHNHQFKYEVDFIESNKLWNYWTYRIKGENTWNITNDLLFKSTVEKVEDIISIKHSDNQFQDFIILEMATENGNKKGLYSTNLKPITEFIYDEIVFAGTLGFLVRIENKYFYIDYSGGKL